MKIKIPNNVVYIINKIYEQGYEAYIVGGCVRDLILGLKPNDYDITTNAKPDDIINIFKDYKIIDNGIKHGTVGVVIDKEVYEITTYRIESEYEDNRRPKEVEFTSNLIEDLKRRDFTINAMAYNDRCGLIDAFEGVCDIERRLIKTVGDPDERFNEDGLRIIRAIRFSAKLNFDIDNETLDSIYKNARLITNISKERVTEEINKIILSEYPDKLTLLETSKILKYLEIYSNITTNEMILLQNKLKVLSKCNYKIEERLLMLEYLLAINTDNKDIISYENNIQSNNLVNKLRYSNSTISYCNTLIKYILLDESSIDIVELKNILNKIGVKNLKQVLTLKEIYYKYIISIEKNKENKGKLKEKCVILNSHMISIDKILQNKECYSIKQLNINGNDLKNMGYKGIEIGKILEKLLQEVILNPKLNEKELLKSLI